MGYNHQTIAFTILVIKKKVYRLVDVLGQRNLDELHVQEL
jgi:hypothetical protein